MCRPRLLVLVLALTAAVVGASLFCARGRAAPAAPAAEPAERGRYLVTAMGCGDCHTPWILGPQGPMPDPKRLFAGHPADLVIEQPPAPPTMPWMTLATATNTAWAGPWGVSFTANLTPDRETGLGAWNAETFRTALRTGRHQGKGRPIQPPMPWPAYATLTDADLDAMFAYFRSLPPISNRVPEPLAPAAAPGATPPGAR